MTLICNIKHDINCNKIIGVCVYCGKWVSYCLSHKVKTGHNKCECNTIEIHQ